MCVYLVMLVYLMFAPLTLTFTRWPWHTMLTYTCIPVFWRCIHIVSRSKHEQTTHRHTRQTHSQTRSNVLPQPYSRAVKAILERYKLTDRLRCGLVTLARWSDCSCGARTEKTGVTKSLSVSEWGCCDDTWSDSEYCRWNRYESCWISSSNSQSALYDPEM